MTRTLSIVIPALNESQNLPRLMAGIPIAELALAGWDAEVVVVDNASTDGTGDVARSLGARVVEQPVRGYGNAYFKGLSSATGDVLVTGDADLTYPFDALPELLAAMDSEDLEFITTDRLSPANRAAMKPSHTVANHFLSTLNKVLFGCPFRDSQSGMWVLRREVWEGLDVRSGGMAFSQEIKNEAYFRGFSCKEIPIEYRARGGQVKLNAFRDGVGNVAQLFEHRWRLFRDGGPVRRGAVEVPTPRHPSAADTTIALPPTADLPVTTPVVAAGPVVAGNHHVVTLPQDLARTDEPGISGGSVLA
ncbi:glycosyltransferase family 2 protein [Kineococcus indalonis]|uniref:glycosyltransferase family 2 protein n=1 Tax=Kineococcus indalonis TaxID=2696566 RepID=UPI0014128446|nr:glycosyltransferase family 2 protein [Kineococcus indalonis]NAZ85049.1 glycosyltransferase [Kineococcus indalonis]